MTPPRIQNDERGITLNKSLAWTITVALVMAGLWVGSMVSSIDTRVATLEAESRNKHIRLEAHDARLRPLEVQVGTAGAELRAMREALTEGINDIRSRLARIEQGSQGSRP
jgi:hypothetical protein